MTDHTDDLWKTFSAVNEWVRFSDSKAGAILVANGILAGFGVPAVVSVYQELPDDYLLLAIVLAGIASVLVSSGFCLKCLNPSLRAVQQSSLIYFSHIAQQFADANSYAERLRERMGEVNWLEDELTNQIWSNSTVANGKFTDVAWATGALAAAIAAAVAFSLLTGLP